MSRTAANVKEDLSACAVMDRWLGRSKSGDQPVRGPEQTGDSSAARAP